MRNMFLDLLRRTIARQSEARIGWLLARPHRLHSHSLNLFGRDLRILATLALLAIPVTAGPALAVPSFAIQTGQPCAACHIGAFGPQLTPYGRAFKIGGYTQGGGKGPGANIPLAAM